MVLHALLIRGADVTDTTRAASRLREAAQRVDDLWEEPDDPEDIADGTVWLADYEEDGVPKSMADALRGLRAVLRGEDAAAAVPSPNPYLHLLDPDDLS